MPLVVECPSCGKKLKVPDNLVGKQVRCADCAGTFTAQSPSAAAPPAPSRAPVPRDDPADDFDEPGGRRSRRRDRGNYAPDRGGMILAFGIISLVSALTGALFIVGLPLGVLAWLWGSKDLKEIAAGRMNPDGQSNTQIGFILGIIGTILNVLILLGLCLYIVIVVVVFGLIIGAATSIPTAPMGPPPQAPKRPRSFVFQAGAFPLRAADYLPGRVR